MSEDGLVDGAADVFVGIKKAEDYHAEMNSAHYEDWIRFLIVLFKPYYYFYRQVSIGRGAIRVLAYIIHMPKLHHFSAPGYDFASYIRAEQ